MRTRWNPVRIGSWAPLLLVGLSCRAQAPDASESMTVTLCDSETVVRVEGPAPNSPSEGRKVAEALMAQWLKKHPGETWETAVRESHTIAPPADNLDLLDGSDAGGVYQTLTPQDLLLWRRETERFVLEGARIFHSADELGSTIAVSCDMCHPDAANTHPETYPKYQVQLGKVALLRDMINWCVQHPVRGPALDPDGPRMRAIEAYILAQRKGKPLDYGRR